MAKVHTVFELARLFEPGTLERLDSYFPSRAGVSRHVHADRGARNGDLSGSGCMVVSVPRDAEISLRSRALSLEISVINAAGASIQETYQDFGGETGEADLKCGRRRPARTVRYEDLTSPEVVEPLRGSDLSPFPAA